MFPVIGPTAEAGFRVQVSRGNAVQDQHGLLRELEYEKVSQNETSAIFLKTYKSGTPIKNSKYPEKSTARLLIWPFDFQFQKTFKLTEEALLITFTVIGEKDMPFMLGYHPAFRLSSSNPTMTTSKRSISLNEVMEAGGRALEIPGSDVIALNDKKKLELKTEGFGHFMLWTEVPNMICIEPITFYPYALPQTKLHEGFDYLEGTKKEFKVWIIPQ
jgi:galactose mutarotase-like enzyme